MSSWNVLGGTNSPTPGWITVPGGTNSYLFGGFCVGWVAAGSWAAFFLNAVLLLGGCAASRLAAALWVGWLLFCRFLECFVCGLGGYSLVVLYWFPRDSLVVPYWFPRDSLVVP